MNKAELTIKEGVFRNKEYTLKALDAPIKLNQNESPFDLPGELKKKILDRVEKSNWNIYPDFIPDELYGKAAAYYGITGDKILLGNGSNEMINTVITGVVEKGRKVVIPVPTFSVYKLLSANQNGSIVEIPLNDDFSFRTDDIASEAKSEGSLTVICSPNNPTGSIMSKKDIIKVIESSGGIVIVDEAYIQFGGESVIDLIDKYDNLIILRTLSKAVGLAGLRLGIMISNKFIISQLGKVKLPYNLDIFSLTALDVVFDNMTVFENTAAYLNNERDRVFNELKKNNKIKFMDSKANFFILKTENPDAVFDKLFNAGILVRNVSTYPSLQGCLRISIGSKEENDKLLDAFSKIFN